MHTMVLAVDKSFDEKPALTRTDEDGLLRAGRWIRNGQRRIPGGTVLRRHEVVSIPQCIALRQVRGMEVRPQLVIALIER